jgi:hypothetical protein
MDTDNTTVASETPTSHTEEEKQEVVKSPEELYLDQIYDKETPKEERAQLIKNKLKEDREKFYELDFFLNNYYSHVVENFKEEGDHDLFVSLTKCVVDDMKSSDYMMQIGGRDVNLFDITVS